MIDTELQDRVNRTLDDLDKRIKNYEGLETELHMKLDDEWDLDDEVAEAEIKTALDQLRSVRSILDGSSNGVQ